MLLWCLLCLLVNVTAFRKKEKPLIVSGVRVENPIGTPGFLGYSEAEEILVEPNAPVTVSIFGYGLETVEYVSFTDSICLTSEYNITFDRFTSQRDTRIHFVHTFQEWDLPWRLCIKQAGVEKQLQLDDDRTWIIAKSRVKETLMPPVVQIILIIVLFLHSSLCSGLNIGLMALSTKELKIIMKSGTPTEARYAAKILPVREEGNRLLSTLLIVNVIVNAAIAILLEDFISGLPAFIASTVGIVIFGEIIPQSCCVRYGLQIGATTIWITRIFMYITIIPSYVCSWMLDKLIGEEIDNFDRNRMVEILKMSIEQNSNNNEMAAITKIAVGAIELINKRACDVMTKIEDVFMISNEAILNSETLSAIVERGYSRIPVFEGDNRNKVKSVLYVNDLALLGRDSNIPVKAVAEFNSKKPWIVDENMPLPHLLEEFKTGKYHLAMVAKLHGLGKDDEEKRLDFFVKESMRLIQPNTVVIGDEPVRGVTYTLVGLITLEDILEEILQAEVIDESDSVLDNVYKQKRNMARGKMSKLFCSETKGENLSLKMFEMVQRFLNEQFKIFNTELLEAKSLETMIQKNIRQVHIIPPKNSNVTHSVNLYENGERSTRFILILEGKATVTFRESQMSFEVGPWTTFGEQVIHAFCKSLDGDDGTKCRKSFSEIFPSEVSVGFYFVPDFEVNVTGFCRFLQLSVPTMKVAFSTTRFVRDIRNPIISLTEDDFDKDEVVRKRSSTTAYMRRSPLDTTRMTSLENLAETNV